MPEACPQVYWLDLDYLEVASVALQSSACLTALVYVEEWCKESQGQLRLGHSSPLNDVQSFHPCCLKESRHPGGDCQRLSCAHRWYRVQFR